MWFPVFNEECGKWDDASPMKGKLFFMTIDESHQQALSAQIISLASLATFSAAVPSYRLIQNPFLSVSNYLVYIRCVFNLQIYYNHVISRFCQIYLIDTHASMSNRRVG